MGRSIWETVAANEIRKGDIVSWHASFDPDRVSDDSARVRVTHVGKVACAEPLPAIVVRVAGPDEKFLRMSGQRTSRYFRQGDPVKRMTAEYAAKVDPASFIARRNRRVPATLG